jgi:hypothetical protein
VNCLDCQPTETSAVAVCGRCGAGLCTEHVVETDEYLVFLQPINLPVPARPPARKRRCVRCDAAEHAQLERKTA